MAATRGARWRGRSGALLGVSGGGGRPDGVAPTWRRHIADLFFVSEDRADKLDAVLFSGKVTAQAVCACVGNLHHRVLALLDEMDAVADPRDSQVALLLDVPGFLVGDCRAQRLLWEVQGRLPQLSRHVLQ